MSRTRGSSRRRSRTPETDSPLDLGKLLGSLKGSGEVVLFRKLVTTAPGVEIVLIAGIVLLVLWRGLVARLGMSGGYALPLPNTTADVANSFVLEKLVHDINPNAIVKKDSNGILTHLEFFVPFTENATVCADVEDGFALASMVSSAQRALELVEKKTKGKNKKHEKDDENGVLRMIAVKSDDMEKVMFDEDKTIVVIEKNTNFDISGQGAGIVLATHNVKSPQNVPTLWRLGKNKTGLTDTPITNTFLNRNNNLSIISLGVGRVTKASSLPSAILASISDDATNNSITSLLRRFLYSGNKGSLIPIAISSVSVILCIISCLKSIRKERIKCFINALTIFLVVLLSALIVFSTKTANIIMLSLGLVFIISGFEVWKNVKEEGIANAVRFILSCFILGVSIMSPSSFFPCSISMLIHSLIGFIKLFQNKRNTTKDIDEKLLEAIVLVIPSVFPIMFYIYSGYNTENVSSKADGLLVSRSIRMSVFLSFVEIALIFIGKKGKKSNASKKSVNSEEEEEEEKEKGRETMKTKEKQSFLTKLLNFISSEKYVCILLGFGILFSLLAIFLSSSHRTRTVSDKTLPFSLEGCARAPLFVSTQSKRLPRRIPSATLSAVDVEKSKTLHLSSECLKGYSLFMSDGVNGYILDCEEDTEKDEKREIDLWSLENVKRSFSLEFRWMKGLETVAGGHVAVKLGKR